MTSKRGAESRRRNEIKPIRLVDHALDRQPVVADGEVDDRLRRARDRNAAGEAEVRSPDGIDTPSDRVQSAASKAMLDRLGAEAQVEELRPRNDSMLLPCEPPNGRPPPLAISRLFD